ncbi:MAG: hypothetical protein ABSE40_22755 [Candidatus Sulfotelmatobacter sp.]|jgi:hypothetical protein
MADDYAVQSARVVAAAKKMCPSCEVIFDSSAAPRWLRFRIEGGSVQLSKGFPHFHVTEVADWSDEKLRQIIEALTSGLVTQ